MKNMSTGGSQEGGERDYLSVSHYMWQSSVEIEGYSVAYFNRIAVFEALYH